MNTNWVSHQKTHTYNPFFKYPSKSSKYGKMGMGSQNNNFFLISIAPSSPSSFP